MTRPGAGWRRVEQSPSPRTVPPLLTGTTASVPSVPATTANVLASAPVETSPPPPHCTAASGSVHCSIATTTFHSRIHFCCSSFCLDYFTVSNTQLAMEPGRNVTPIDEHGTDRTVAMAHIGGASILNITQPTRYYTLHPSPPHTASERCAVYWALQ